MEVFFSPWILVFGIFLKDLDFLKGHTPLIKSTTLQEYFESHALTLLVYSSVGFDFLTVFIAGV
jgi:hypothetical protein